MRRNLSDSMHRPAGACVRPAIFAALWLLVASCGGGGGGAPAGPSGEPPPPTVVTFGIGAPQAALGQEPLSIALGSTAQPALLAATHTRATQTLQTGDERFVFPPGPDAQGHTLPRIGGSYDMLTGTYTQVPGSKFWLDLPASAGDYQVAVQVNELIPAATEAGQIVIEPRQAYDALTGRIRLRFQADALSVCLGWDSQPDGVYETEECMTRTTFEALWETPLEDLPIPHAVQRAAAATDAGWRWLRAQFDLSLAALGAADSNAAALADTPAGANAMTIGCSVPPTDVPVGGVALAWLDRNDSTRFDDGDDVRLTASNCWLPAEDEPDPAAGRFLEGVLELRGYRRNVGAAPTFFGLQVNHTATVGDDVTVSDDVVIGGGFSVDAPGIAASGSVGAYTFTADNMVAAASLAARSVTLYPTAASLAYNMLNDVLYDPVEFRIVPACRNTDGIATLTYEDAGPTGPSRGDKLLLTLENCDRGPAGHPTLLDGSLRLKLWDVTAAGMNWTMQADARVDLSVATPRSASRRLGEFGVEVRLASGQPEVDFRSQAYNPAEPVSGVFVGIENGVVAYQVGCTSAQFRGAFGHGQYTLVPNHVMKVANRVFSLRMSLGDAFLFTPDADGLHFPDHGSAFLLSISQPVCTALGVPATGVSGTEPRVVFDTWPDNDGERVLLKLLDRQDGALLREVETTWTALAR